MKERILEFLQKENKTSAQFAEEIGVQPSGISHILSGRNRPSLDFAIKMLEKYSFLSVEWLLFGKGSMYKEPRMADLFDTIDLTDKEKVNKAEYIKKELSYTPDIETEIAPLLHHEQAKEKVKRIVWFYEDNSFEEFFPTKS